MVQTFTVKMNNMEVRKVEEVELEIGEKTYRSLNVHFDDEEGARLVFKDKVIENLEKYEKGTIGTLTLTIATENTTKTAKNGNPYVAEKTTMIIKDFTPNTSKK